MELQYRQQSQDHKGLWGNNNPSLINHSLAFASVINLRLECTITVKITTEWPIHTFAVSHLLFPSIPIRSYLPLASLSLYSSYASLPLLIPSQLSPPAHLTSNRFLSKPGPTGTRQICTNTHYYLSGLEKQHSKTKKKKKEVASPHHDAHSYMVTTISLLGWKEKKNLFFSTVIWPVFLIRVGKELQWLSH